MKLLLFASVALTAFLSTPAHGFLGGLFDDCKKVRFSGSTCAYLFDDDGCEGWELPIDVGYTELRWRHKNDAESVVVRPGCIFKGEREGLLLVS